MLSCSIMVKNFIAAYTDDTYDTSNNSRGKYYKFQFQLFYLPATSSNCVNRKCMSPKRKPFARDLIHKSLKDKRESTKNIIHG